MTLQFTIFHHSHFIAIMDLQIFATRIQRKRRDHRCNHATLQTFFTSPIPLRNVLWSDSVAHRRPTSNGAKGRGDEEGGGGRIGGRGGERRRERRRRWSHLQVDYHSEKKRGETSSWPENNWATSLRLTFDK